MFFILQGLVLQELKFFKDQSSTKSVILHTYTTYYRRVSLPCLYPRQCNTGFVNSNITYLINEIASLGCIWK